MVTSMKHTNTLLIAETKGIESLSYRVKRGIVNYFKVFFPGNFPMDKMSNGNYPRIVSDECNSVICPVCGHGEWRIGSYNEIKCSGNCGSIFHDHGVYGLKPISTPKLKK
jgi:hypothetical protein